MNLVNLTPHSIQIFDHDGQNAPPVTFPPSGQVARVEEKTVFMPQSTFVNQGGLAIPLVKKVYGSVEGLPAPVEGIGYLVSVMVLQAAASLGLGRNDLYAPDTGTGAVRDAGRLVGTTRLVVA